MLKMNRTNLRGQQYYLSEVYGPKTQTEIRTGDKKIIVDHHIMTISQGWYDWQIQGHFIQKAFAFMTADEREFLLTGLTAIEWKELFNDDDGEDI